MGMACNSQASLCEPCSHIAPFRGRLRHLYCPMLKQYVQHEHGALKRKGAQDTWTGDAGTWQGGTYNT